MSTNSLPQTLTDREKPRLLDLFCCAGGAAAGYHRAGFEVVGVDIKPQPRYPFLFVQGDALDFVRRNGKHFDAIHASPPCQAYSATKSLWRGKGRPEHPDLIAPTRDALQTVGAPWIIENVPGAPLIDPIMLCGAMFDLRVYRHRLFESSVLLPGPAHPPHSAPVTPLGKPPIEGHFLTVAGHFSGMREASAAMGIDWMTRDELSQAIPPAYTEYLGLQLLAHVQQRMAA